MRFVVETGERKAFVQVLFADRAGGVRHGGTRCERPADQLRVRAEQETEKRKAVHAISAPVS
ncbi:hypothetical protein [Embleya sp. NPDC059237]|uniref:hypothetical protein n=1 Tax=Embleya sp. NPDC059237 TaxID=3346784 RepID=UPI003678554D